MKVWIFYSEACDYPTDQLTKECADRQAAQKWLNENAHYSIELVIEGRELTAKPVEVVKKYEIADAPIVPPPTYGCPPGAVLLNNRGGHSE